ncbi:hypothetical protein BDP55DRAFT_630839 [Colletotrichum godetiae]|uniref:Uncharacterized protein n=1 Tax=Colletotrichum godetiae TaxID=1209918 RepID=A0AAJ0EZ30_9PEZI|nr:uncharacterized protein BDP55DRAFT_630839 [Colletotrichum godetiae]KAK1676749.1 hypothetical protein BDP55DRAFT_630839 [Colletotrichum godetiae]
MTVHCQRKSSAASSSVATKQISIANTSESRTTALVSGRRLIDKSQRYCFSLLIECSCFNYSMRVAQRPDATLCDGFFDAMSRYPRYGYTEGLARVSKVQPFANCIIDTSLLVIISGILTGPTRQAKGSSELAFARFTTVDAQDRLMLPQPAIPCCLNPYDVAHALLYPYEYL